MISYWFFATFSHHNFLYDGNDITPLHCQDVSTVANDAFHAKKFELRTLTAEVKEGSIRRNAAIRADKRRRVMAEPSSDRAIRNVYHYIRSSVTKNLMSDCGDANAELTAKSVTAVIEMLTEYGMNDEDVFFDGGCSYNVCASHVAQSVGCRAWGCEYVPTRIFLGAANMVKAIEDKEDIGRLINPKIAFVPLDLFSLTTFGPTRVAYFFDEAFPIRLVEHLCNVAANTPGVNNSLL